MKRVLAAFMALSMLFMLASCGKDDEPLPEIIASLTEYTEDECILYVQDLGGVYSELYDAEGLHVKFAKDAKICDSKGNELTREDMRYGQTVKVKYSGKLIKKHPKTIKVYEIVTIG